MKRSLVQRGGMLAAVVACVALAGAAPASAAPGDGSAYGVDVKLLGQPAVKLGPLAAASTTGPTANTAAGATVAGVLTAGVINTSAVRDDNSGSVTAKASVADVGLPVLQPALGAVGIKAVEAVCTATQEGVKGSSTLADAKLGSVGAVDANPAPNTQVKVALGPVNVATLVLNEQIKNSDGSLTVNALHLKLLGGVVGALGSGDVILSSATCGPAAPPMPLASGAGLWVGLGVLGAVAVPVGLRFSRRRTGADA
ncbi:choice-of-anchor P family protein [Amycolatopsis sp. PS_44_ISF1]|uniref:choice-of-anchor P family protein n=1 Tax=Amycolatopsis sp. PS_44_ISF1 TaxID=2974917 RepID=UPI0028E0806F|nr:choice-of-anchor P family protein [Amycolatopsis sp. PS_44_ISF1]MDT8909667.1 choice-of-anchor P family protein [Amycolatopsis sp. PS_44_ISF1]